MAKQLEPELRKRLHFIGGQARGIERMLDEGRDLNDILTQLLAVQSAARAAAELIVRDRMTGRIKELVHQMVLQCAGECELCDELKRLSGALEEMDYSSVLDELSRLRS